ncbi:MAG: hypothetical protein ACOC78_02465 [Actinomycetota bacterium]
MGNKVVAPELRFGFERRRFLYRKRLKENLPDGPIDEPGKSRLAEYP